MRRRIILSIDGGGIRGIMPLAILKRINDLLKYQLQSRIDLYAGTSAGSLIAGALMLKTELGYIYNITDILNLYSFRSSNIFKTSENQEHSPLKLIMERTFQNITIKDQHHDFLFTAEDNENGELFVISNQDKNLQDTKLSKILLACSAIKDYFEPIIINGKTLSDGVTVMKNPSLLALNYYKNKFPEDEMTLLSFGTGDVSRFYDDDIEKSVEEVHNTLVDMDESLEHFNYFRIQPKIKHANHEMDDTSMGNIENLLVDSQVFINANTGLFDKIVRSVKRA